MTPEIVHLTPAETAADRPFTDPSLSLWDLRILDAMRAGLARALRAADPCPPGRPST